MGFSYALADWQKNPSPLPQAKVKPPHNISEEKYKPPPENLQYKLEVSSFHRGHDVYSRNKEL